MVYYASSAHASVVDLVSAVGLAFDVVGGSSEVAGEGMGSSAGRTDVVAAEPVAI